MTRYVLVIGAQRSGTTYLYHLLDEHPEIAMAKPLRPEPKFFLDPAAVARGLSWYESTYFGHDIGSPVHGEKSTSYMESPAAAERAAALVPGAEILVMLRDPIERAMSNWRFSRQSGWEDRPLADALTPGDAREWDPGKTSVNPFAYLERGRYAQQLEVWRERFPGRVHAFFIEELASDRSLVRAVYASIGVDDSYEPEFAGAINASESSGETLSSEQRVQLRAYFAASDALLRKQLGRELPWDAAS